MLAAAFVLILWIRTTLLGAVARALAEGLAALLLTCFIRFPSSFQLHLRKCVGFKNLICLELIQDDEKLVPNGFEYIAKI